MPTPLVHRSPAKMNITHLKSGDSIDAQYNPTEWSEEISVSWGHLKPIGLSHTVAQYGNTENQKFEFDMPFSAYDERGNQANNMQRSRRFLQALCFGPRGTQDIIGSAPSRILVMWPKVISLTCILLNVKFKHTDFNNEGLTVRFVASLSVEEVRDKRLYYEDVLKFGTTRSP